MEHSLGFVHTPRMFRRRGIGHGQISSVLESLGVWGHTYWELKASAPGNGAVLWIQLHPGFSAGGFLWARDACVYPSWMDVAGDGEQRVANIP